MAVYEVSGWYVARMRFEATVEAGSAREAARVIRYEGFGNDGVEVWHTETERQGRSHVTHTRLEAPDDTEAARVAYNALLAAITSPAAAPAHEKEG